MAIDWKSMTDDEVLREYQAGAAEHHSRWVLRGAEERLNELNAEVQQAKGVLPGDAWVQPTGAHDAYPLDFEVSHNGKMWRSTTPANVWEPGVSGWAEVVAEGEVAAWVQPTGGHDAYAAGAQVQHNGRLWESVNNGNVWEPGSVGAESLWKDLGPYPA